MWSFMFITALLCLYHQISIHLVFHIIYLIMKQYAWLDMKHYVINCLFRRKLSLEVEMSAMKERQLRLLLAVFRQPDSLVGEPSRGAKYRDDSSHRVNSSDGAGPLGDLVPHLPPQWLPPNKAPRLVVAPLRGTWWRDDTNEMNLTLRIWGRSPLLAERKCKAIVRVFQHTLQA
jgi:hypothetical protein